MADFLFYHAQALQDRFHQLFRRAIEKLSLEAAQWRAQFFYSYGSLGRFGRELQHQSSTAT
jgi:hypothetical protein